MVGCEHIDVHLIKFVVEFWCFDWCALFIDPYSNKLVVTMESIDNLFSQGSSLNVCAFVPVDCFFVTWKLVLDIPGMKMQEADLLFLSKTRLVNLVSFYKTKIETGYKAEITCV